MYSYPDSHMDTLPLTYTQIDSNQHSLTEMVPLTHIYSHWFTHAYSDLHFHVHTQIYFPKLLYLPHTDIATFTHLFTSVHTLQHT